MIELLARPETGSVRVPPYDGGYASLFNDAQFDMLGIGEDIPVNMESYFCWYIKQPARF